MAGLMFVSLALVARATGRVRELVRLPRLCLGAMLIGAPLAAMTLSGPVFAAAPAPLGATPNLTESQLAIDLREGAMTRTVPANLDPPLALVSGDVPLMESD